MSQLVSAEYDECGAPFSLQHGLGCKKGGLVKKSHTDLRDSDAWLVNTAQGGEPILVAENDCCGQAWLQAD